MKQQQKLTYLDRTLLPTTRTIRAIIDEDPVQKMDLYFDVFILKIKSRMAANEL
ncbi:unnamed protein product [Acidithrix sp. C25]|nr:unnamed protein product [Acidithrix sp. C25]